MLEGEYVSDHIDYLKDKGRRFTPIRYMELSDRQDMLKREEHVDWLFEKGKHLEMSARSSQLAVVYFDCYMAQKKHSLKAVELGRTAALFVAHMLEKKSELSVEQIKVLTHDRYSIEEVFFTRNYILIALQYKLDRCTASDIIWFICERTHNKFAFLCRQAEILAEICYKNYEVSLYGPIQIALAACTYAFEVVATDAAIDELCQIAVGDFEVDFKEIERITILLRNN